MELPESTRCTKNVLLVGDANCGQTSLIRRICLNDVALSQSETPIGQVTNRLIDGNDQMELKFFDIADYYNQLLQPKECPRMDITLMSYALNNLLSTCDNEQDKWTPGLNMDISNVTDHDQYLRNNVYGNMDVILMCFSIHDFDSYESIKDKWIVDVDRFRPDIPIILVGTKADLREWLPKRDLVSMEMGRTLASQIRADVYFECSALKGQGVDELFGITSVTKPERKRAKLSQRFRKWICV